MPFGKRGQIGIADAEGGAISLPVMPPNPTTAEWMTCFWKICKATSIGQGVISLGYHTVLSVVLALAILFVSQDALTRFADAMTPYWPLLPKVRPYMDARGHHQLFLYLSAMYFKDAVLIVLFSVRNICWVLVVLFQVRSEISLQLRQAQRLSGLVAPVTLIYWLDQLYYGPPHASDVFTYGGRIFVGIVGPAVVAVGLVFFLFTSPLVLLIPTGEGEGFLWSKFKRIRNLR